METKKGPQIIRRLVPRVEGVVAEAEEVVAEVAEGVVAEEAEEVVAEGVVAEVAEGVVAEVVEVEGVEGVGYRNMEDQTPEAGVQVVEVAVEVKAVEAGVEVGVEVEGAAGYRNTADRIQEELRPVAEAGVAEAVAVAEGGEVEPHNTEDQILGQMPVRELRDRRRGRSTYR